MTWRRAGCIAVLVAGVACARDAAAEAGSAPGTDELAGQVKAYLLAEAGALVGSSASIKLGGAQPVSARVLAIDESGVRAESRGLALSASWASLGSDGIYVLGRSLLGRAPPKVRAAHILLGAGLGLLGGAELTDRLVQLAAADPAAAKEVEAALRSREPAPPAPKELPERKPRAAEQSTVYRNSYEFVPPEDAGQVNVKTRYGAVGDGVHDDTAALQKAISENFNRMVYLPNGTYLVSGTLIGRDAAGNYRFGMFLHGQSRTRTVIRLKDRCEGFQDPKSPRPVVKPCSRDQERGGNMGHWNYVINLTIDTGSGNPGAVGVEYIASNNGSMRDVTIRSGDGQGVAGVDLTMPWPGPCLLSDIHVMGFDYGLMLDHWIYSVTVEHLRLERQRKAGIKNDNQILCARKVTSLNAVPAIESTGMLILLDSTLSGGAGGPAIKSRGFTYLRNVKADGYSGVTDKLGPEVGEYFSRPAQSLFPSLERSLCLPVEDTPFVPYDPPELWARAGGSSSSIQAAIDSGMPTVYIRGGGTIDRTVVIRGNVRRIFNVGGLQAGRSLGDAPAWRYEGAVHPAVVMEYGGYPSLVVEHASPKALVIRHTTLVQKGTPGCGPLFVEDTCSWPWVLEHSQRVYFRHLNIEHEDFCLKNLGARVWILGWKTERQGVQIETRNGGYTEVLGGLVYPAGAVPQDRPMFVNHESNVAIMVRQASFVPNGIHKIKMVETRDGETRQTEKLIEGLYVGMKTPPELAVARPGPKEQARPARADAPAAEGASPKGPPAEAVAARDAILAARLAREVSTGATIRAYLPMLRQTAEVLSVEPGDALAVSAGGLRLTLPWSKLGLVDKKGLALAVCGDDEEGACLAAFYLLAVGEKDAAATFLAKVPKDSAERVRAECGQR